MSVVGELARHPLRQAELAGERVDLALEQARDRLHVGQPVASLDEEPLVVLEQVRRADHGVAQAVGPGVLEELSHALLHVVAASSSRYGARRHPLLLLAAVRALDDEREDDDAAARDGAHQLVAPVGLVVGEDLADRLVAARVAAKGVEGCADRLLDRRAPSDSRVPRGRSSAADVALGQQQATPASAPRALQQIAGGDAGVDPPETATTAPRRCRPPIAFAVPAASRCADSAGSNGTPFGASIVCSAVSPASLIALMLGAGSADRLGRIGAGPV